MESKTQKTQKNSGEKVGNTYTTFNPRSRHWFFTLNNYSEEEYKLINSYFSKLKDCKYVIGKEVGASGTPHLQGAVSFGSNKYFNTLKNLWPRVHWEKTRNAEAAAEYCKKEGNYIEVIPDNNITQYENFMRAEYDNVIWKKWQADILEIINGPVNRRSVYWYWETTGNIGKSFLVKYIDWKYKAIIVNGKQSDVFNGIRNYLEEHKIMPEVVIIDIPRTNQNYVCYGTMEKIKDGLMYSGKYEGGKIRLCPLHLIVMANFRPDYSKMSGDRFEVYELEAEPITPLLSPAPGGSDEPAPF